MARTKSTAPVFLPAPEPEPTPVFRTCTGWDAEYGVRRLLSLVEDETASPNRADRERIALAVVSILTDPAFPCGLHLDALLKVAEENLENLRPVFDEKDWGEWDYPEE